jgi:anti-sigma-K factor RskA
MNPEELARKLLQAGRRARPSDTVPYAFERRVMAAITRRRPAADDPLAVWAAGLWRAAVACSALTLVLGGIHWLTPAGMADSDPSTADTPEMLLALDDDSLSAALLPETETSDTW